MPVKPSSSDQCCVYPHFISNLFLPLSFYPSWVSSPCGPQPFCFSSECVSPLFLSSLLSIICSLCSSLFCPCLFLSLCRTPNVSSNGNPGYESLPLTDRQSPPPSVSSSVLVHHHNLSFLSRFRPASTALKICFNLEVERLPHSVQIYYSAFAIMQKIFVSLKVYCSNPCLKI